MPLKIRGPALPQAGPKIQVVRVKTVTPQRFIILSPELLTAHIHFGRRSKECTLEETKTCVHCTAGVGSRRVKGYLDALSHPSGDRVILELTPPACAAIELFCTERELRGLIVDISKTKGGPQGRYIVRSDSTTIGSSILPAYKDPMPTVRLLWTWGDSDGQ